MIACTLCQFLLQRKMKSTLVINFLKGNEIHTYLLFCFCFLKACSFQWILMLLVLALHSYLTFLLPVPGCPSGYLGPGGLQNEGQYRNCTGGSARYIDIKIFGREHIYQHPTAKIIYDTTEPFDPEGFLGEH